MNRPEKVEVVYKARVTKDDDQVEVSRTLDMSQLTDEDILSYALDSIIILSQAADRRNALKKDEKGKISGEIPTTGTYLVPRPGQRATADPMSKLVKVLGKERAEAAVAKHGSAERVIEIMKDLI